MKKIFFYSCIVCAISSCSNSNDVTPTLEVGFPQEWVLTVDEPIIPQDPSEARYTYIYTNKSAMFRDDILKSYPLDDLADEENCLFYISEINTIGGKPTYTIQLDNERILYLGVGPSSNKEEVHLFISQGEEVTVIGNPSHLEPPGGNNDSDEYQFYFHQMPSVDGEPTVAIESVSMPGWYISDTPPGFNYAANVVTLQKEKSPEEATKWQGRGVK